MARKKRKKRLFGTIVRNIFLFGVASGFIVAGFILLWAASLNIPDLQSFEQRKVTQSTKIFDQTGEILLFDVHENIQRTVVPFEDISRHVKNAAVAIEDTEFYEHFGIRPLATLRAVFLQPLRGKGVQGGSTITQQVVKNSILTSERKISRKIKEWVLSIKLEQNLTKEQILELYLNEAPYGGALYGVEEASRAFFNKTAADLSLAEAAYLAALPQAPTRYSPYGNNRDLLEARKNLVLDQMLTNNFITRNEFDEAHDEIVIFEAPSDTGIKAPHFVMYVREYLENTYGKRAIEERGFRVITTLDYDLQQKAEKIVAQFAEENTEKFKATNAALTAVDPKTGNIQVMVGSRNYFDDEIDGNFNVATAHRQPGSAFKPFVYATAFKKGYTPETVVFDAKTQFSTTCDFYDLSIGDGCYAPSNYDNTFRGPVTLRNALAQSMNVPAVKVLYLTGLQESLQTARSMGIRSLADVNQYGLTLVLGGGEVALLDITSAYGVFANEGVRHGLNVIQRIEDAEGNIIEEHTLQPIRVLDDQVALQVTDVLADNAARTPAFGSRSFLHFPGMDVAAKTGTTNDYRDAWIVGYTPNLAVGAWAGNNDNSPMDKKVAGFVIAPLWNAFLQEVFASSTHERFREPVPYLSDNLKPILRGEWQGGDSYFIDTISGKLATEHTPAELQEERFVENIHSILHWVDKTNPRGAPLDDPTADGQYKAWEHGLLVWKKQHGYDTSTTTATSSVPTEYDDVHLPEYEPKITVVSPSSQTPIPKNSSLLILTNHESHWPLDKVDVFINDRYIDTITTEPFSISIPLATLEGIKSFNTLKLIAYDTVLNKGELITSFRTE